MTLKLYKHPFEQYNKSNYFKLICPLEHEARFQEDLFAAFYVYFSELKSSIKRLTSVKYHPDKTKVSEIYMKC